MASIYSTNSLNNIFHNNKSTNALSTGKILASSNAGTNNYAPSFKKTPPDTQKRQLLRKLMSPESKNNIREYYVESTANESGQDVQDTSEENQQKRNYNIQNNIGVSYVEREYGMAAQSAKQTTDQESLLKKKVNYNYKEVASKIQRAKTSISASQAVSAAKRKISELKRKIALGDSDKEELEIALTHAKKMETIALRKKHHLEMEEMISHTIKTDEHNERNKEAIDKFKDSLIEQQKESIQHAQDEIDAKRDETKEYIKEEYLEKEIISEEMYDRISQMIDELSQDEFEAYEELMSFLDEMQILDPHMSKEHFEEIKKKHRSSENKEMVKADMQYLKDMIKHQQQSGTGVLSQGLGIAASPAATQGAQLINEAAQIVATGAIDVGV